MRDLEMRSVTAEYLDILSHGRDDTTIPSTGALLAASLPCQVVVVGS